MAAMFMITQNNARKAEKALKEILDKADNNLNGKVGLEEFIQIIEINGVEIDEEELKEFHSLADENGEISKTDLIVHTKASKFWKGYMESKSKPGALISKVEVMSKADKSQKTETAFRLFDKNRDGYVTREEFTKVSKKLNQRQIEAVFAKFDANGDGRLSMEEFTKVSKKLDADQIEVVFAKFDANGD